MPLPSMKWSICSRSYVRGNPDRRDFDVTTNFFTAPKMFVAPAGFIHYDVSEHIGQTGELG